MSRFDALISWRSRIIPRHALTADLLVEALSVEGLSRGRVPAWANRPLTAFRHLTQRSRLAAARRWLEEHGGAA